jgi:hypothetical protein
MVGLNKILVITVIVMTSICQMNELYCTYSIYLDVYMKFLLSRYPAINTLLIIIFHIWNHFLEYIYKVTLVVKDYTYLIIMSTLQLKNQ